MKYKPTINGEIPVVIGANFGDEGKGMMTDYLVNEMVKDGDRVICVRHNGGAQAGHTVNYLDGRRFVFNSIPSGCGANSSVIGIFGPDFFLNPPALLQEIDRFVEFFGWKPRLYFSNCRIVTPWDMYANQISESNKGKSAHGSCGHGIYESFLRNKRTNQTKFHSLNTSTMKDDLLNMRSYGLTRLRDISGGKFDAFGYSDWHLFIAFEKSVRELHSWHDDFTDLSDLSYRVVAEGAQGLGLSMKLKGVDPWYPHLTPSDPGLESAITAVKSFSREHCNTLTFSPIYVTRSYLTRHGNGPMYSDSSKKGSKFSDETNFHNRFQGDQRKGDLDIEDLRSRIMNDLFYSEQSVPIWTPMMAVTWADKDRSRPDYLNLPLPIRFSSDGKTREDVIDWCL